jgi:hypothetical protein
MSEEISAIRGSEASKTRKMLEKRNKEEKVATVQARDESLFSGKAQPSTGSASIFNAEA